MQGEGHELFVAYLRRLVGERAQEDYSALVENTGEGAAGLPDRLQCFVCSMVWEMLCPLCAATAGCSILCCQLPASLCHSQSFRNQTLLS